MPKENQLKSKECWFICALSLACVSQNKISECVNNSREAVHSCLQNPEAVNAKLRSGRPQKNPTRTGVDCNARPWTMATEQEKFLTHWVCLLVCHIRNGSFVAVRIFSTESSKSLYLLQRSTKREILWATERINWRPVKWKSIIFSTEKKSNLVWPDGLIYYWHAIRNGKNIFHLSTWSRIVYGMGCFFCNLSVIVGDNEWSSGFAEVNYSSRGSFIATCWLVLWWWVYSSATKRSNWYQQGNKKLTDRK